jgi:hypothetical protein
MAQPSVENQETDMARIANLTNSPLDATDFDKIDQAIQRGRVLRAQAFRSHILGVYRSLFGRPIGDKPTMPRGYGDCASAA